MTEETRKAVILSELSDRKADIVISFGRTNAAPSQNLAFTDSMLNEAYQKCLQGYPAPQQQKLREVQRLWITYRDLAGGSTQFVTMHRASQLRQMSPARSNVAAQSPAARPSPPVPSATVDPNTADPFATGRHP